MLGEIFGVDGIVVVIVLAVVLFGGAAIPKLARNLGSAKNQFEKGLEDGKKATGPSNGASRPRDARVGTRSRLIPWRTAHLGSGRSRLRNPAQLTIKATHCFPYVAPRHPTDHAAANRVARKG